MAEGGRGFGPTVLAGLAGAVLAAVAAARDWATASGSAAGVEVTASVTGSASAPLGVALALVALAAWGVVLVLRGRARQVVAAAGALAAAGVLAAVVAGFRRAQDDAVRAVVDKGGTGDVLATSLTGWYYACAVGAALTLVAFAVAVVTAARWPTMGARYDAPGARGPTPSASRSAAAAGVAAPVSDQDMWHALDDGRDPTA
jgi:uncharacterized membrane protein (TIGR02234 family)